MGTLPVRPLLANSGWIALSDGTGPSLWHDQATDSLVGWTKQAYYIVLLLNLSGTNPPCQLSHSIDIASMREALTPARLDTEAVPLLTIITGMYI